MTRHEKLLAELIDQTEALCRVYIGKNAESEQWGDTLRRLDALDKLVKRVRRSAAKEALNA